MILFKILAGIDLLVLGRRLFRLFVALIGFMSGIHIGAYLFPGKPEWMILAIALTAGKGALIALILQGLAIGLAGFSAGAGLITEAGHLDRSATALLFVGLFIVGVVVQSRLMKMKPS